MRIALLEFDPSQKSATGVRGRAIKSFLEKEGHSADILSPPAGAGQEFHQNRFGLWPRIKRKALRRASFQHLWDFLADHLEPQIRDGQYDVVIGRGQDMAHVLTRDLQCVKILDMANILFLEGYYVWGPNLTEVEETFEKEMRIFHGVDHIFCHHELLTKYFIQQFGDRGNLSNKAMTVRMGCDPVSRHAQSANPPRIVYAGSYYYIQDPYLLAWLTKISPFKIDCFGPTDPSRSFLPAALHYKGFAPGIDFLADYQFGLITVSRDLLRQNSPSTKFAYYFAAGLPVLFPEWMKEGYTYPDCAIPYNEDNFVERVEAFSETGKWERMSKAARELAENLSWNNVLRPLGDLLQTTEKKCL